MKRSASRFLALIALAVGAFSFMILLGAWSFAPSSLSAATPEPTALPQTVYNCEAVSEIPVSECEALVALVNTTFSEYLRNDGWLKDDAPCTWGGLTCGDRHVQHIKVTGKWIGFGGPSLPPELGNLVHLQSLDLSHNNLTGSIPEELGNLTNLKSLDLSWNHLTGSIPGGLSNLINLQSLDLSSNGLSGGVLPELSHLTNLQTLDLHGNPLEASLPPQFGNLVKLQSLDLSYTRLTGSIPSELANLTSLQTLNLGNNQLTGSIPPELANLTNLQTLDLSAFPASKLSLTGSIPPEIGNLAHLESLDLSSNHLTGSIPSELGELVDLRSLDLGGNQLSGGIPPELGNLAQLTRLDLGRNDQLTGSIPMKFCLRTVFRLFDAASTYGSQIQSCEDQLLPWFSAVWGVLLMIALIMLATSKKHVGQLLIGLLILVAIAYFVIAGSRNFQ